MSEIKEECECTIIHEETISSIEPLMPTVEEFEKASDFFKILSDKTRVKIIWALDESEMCVCDIAYICKMTKSAISHQLALLRKENLVKSRRDGKEIFYSLKDNHVKFMLENSLNHIKEK